jgi:hypothetical protein
MRAGPFREFILPGEPLEARFRDKALGAQDAVHRGDQLDELVNRPIAFLRRQPEVVTYPFEFVDDRVLGFLLPVIEKDVLEQFREFGVGIGVRFTPKGKPGERRLGSPSLRPCTVSPRSR